MLAQPLLAAAALSALLAVPAFHSPSPSALAHAGDTLAAGLVDELAVALPNQPTGFLFAPDGTLVVWTKKGRVYANPGGPAAPPFLDLRQEVGLWSDHGLMAVELDPAFAQNGYLYLYYAVDAHHLFNFGTPAYSPATDERSRATIARLTRFTAVDPTNLNAGVIPASRYVLIGATPSTGIPICGTSHGAGDLLFGHDGSLILSAGDSNLGILDGSCVGDGLMEPGANVDAYRSQWLDGPNGKLLRIDAATGDGLSNNPFFDAQAPGSWRSRVWALGLRNPFRMALLPEEHQSRQLTPGTIVLGDIGAGHYEELNVVHDGGGNYGWPTWEGFEPNVMFGLPVFPHANAPNPLAGPSCPPLFLFSDLLIEATLNALFWPNPCAPAQEVPSTLQRFVHERPQLVWGHPDEFTTPTSRVPAFDGAGEATSIELGTPTAPAGQPFFGRCSIGGVHFEGQGFPPALQGLYFHADFGQGWIQGMRFDMQHKLTEVVPLATERGTIVHLGTDPGHTGLYYLTIAPPALRRIVPGDDAAPLAEARAIPRYGAGPLTVRFDAGESDDPEGLELSFAWDFGDGVDLGPLATRPDPVHVYPSEDITALGSFVSRLDELSPPQPMGSGNPSAEVLRDGVYPDSSESSPLAQFDTTHVNGQGQPDKGGSDWLGWSFPTARTLVGLLFQEGLHQASGGWFQNVAVEVRSAGVWTAVTSLELRPAYAAAAGESFAVHQVLFAPTLADAVRLSGAPGGAASFVSAAELRVLALPLAPSGLPTRFDASVTVSDPAGQTATQATPVWLDNSPPQLTITSPPAGFTYLSGVAEDITLAATINDAEHTQEQLVCSWNIDLIHDNHAHPEAPIDACAGTFRRLPHGELAGDAIHWELRLTVTDALGLSQTATRRMLPQGDCNLNGVLDAQDVAGGFSSDVNVNGLPDECEPIVAYGCGVNPPSSLTVLAGAPVPGQTLRFGFDAPPGTQAPNAIPLLWITRTPHPAYPCGGLLPAWGLPGPGELLTDVTTQIAPLFVGQVWTGPGVPALLDLPIPPEPALLDQIVFVQGVLFSLRATSELRLGLTNGLRVRFGS